MRMRSCDSAVMLPANLWQAVPKLLEVAAWKGCCCCCCSNLTWKPVVLLVNLEADGASAAGRNSLERLLLLCRNQACVAPCVPSQQAMPLLLEAAAWKGRCCAWRRWGSCRRFRAAWKRYAFASCPSLHSYYYKLCASAFNLGLVPRVRKRFASHTTRLIAGLLSQACVMCDVGHSLSCSPG